MKNQNVKSRSITIRFPEKSASRLKKNATSRKVTLSDYIRNRISAGSFSDDSASAKKRSATDREKRNSTMSKIRRSTSNLGNNLNQAAKAINAHVIRGESTSDKSLISAVEKTQVELKNVTHAISRIERRS